MKTENFKEVQLTNEKLQNIDSATWKYIPDSLGYEVSADGQLRRKTSTGYRVLAGSLHNRGYVIYYVYYTNGRKREYGHRLVLITFSGENKLKPFVNHKDGNKLNNALENLEWATNIENLQHASNMGLLNVKKPKSTGGLNHNAKPVIDTNTGKTYSCLADAANDLGIKRSTLSGYLSGFRKNKSTISYL